MDIEVVPDVVGHGSGQAHRPPPAVPSIARRAEVHRALGEPHRLAIVDALVLSDRAPSELATLTGLGSNLVAFHLGVLEEAGVVERLPSEGDARRRYVRLRPDALVSLQARPRIVADDVLFVCTHNSARSQLAAALWERATGRPARSAGHDPAPAVHRLAVEVARDRGLDLGDVHPRGLPAVSQPPPDLVVSVCDRARETGWPFTAPALHWSVPDPVDGGRARFEEAYDLLAARITALATAREDPA